MDCRLKRLVFRSVGYKTYRLLPLMIVCALAFSALARDITVFLGKMPEITGTNIDNLAGFMKYRYVIFSIGDFYDTGYKVKKKNKYTDFYVINNFKGRYFFVKLPYRLHNSDIKGKRFIGRIVGDSGLEKYLSVANRYVLTGENGACLCIELAAGRFMIEKIVFTISFLGLLWSFFMLLCRFIVLSAGEKYFLRNFSKDDRQGLSFQLQRENRCLYAEGDNFLFLKDYVVWLNEKSSFYARSIDDLVWIYVAKRKSGNFFRGKMTGYCLRLCFSDGNVSSVTMPDEGYAESLLSWLYERYSIIAGYNPDIDKLFKSDPEKIKKLV